VAVRGFMMRENAEILALIQRRGGRRMALFAGSVV